MFYGFFLALCLQLLFIVLKIEINFILFFTHMKMKCKVEREKGTPLPLLTTSNKFNWHPNRLRANRLATKGTKQCSDIVLNVVTDEGMYFYCIYMNKIHLSTQWTRVRDWQMVQELRMIYMLLVLSAHTLLLVNGFLLHFSHRSTAMHSVPAETIPRFFICARNPRPDFQMCPSLWQQV